MLRAKLSRITVLTLTLTLALTCISLVGPPRLEADDFRFYEPGARAAALGGAFTALADDASALFYNPAGLAFLGEFRLKTNIAFGKRQLTADWPAAGRRYRSEPGEFMGAVSASWQPAKRVTLATGLFFPYNFESFWSPGWVGEPVCQRNELASLYFRSALSVEFVKGLALSAGVDVVSSNLRWRHVIPFDYEGLSLTLEHEVESVHRLRGSGLSFVAGVMWKIVPALQVGARYQRGLAMEYSGTNDFIRNPLAPDERILDPNQGTRTVGSLMDLFYAKQNVTGELKFPDELVVGFALTPLTRVSLYVDVQWDGWSEFGDWTFVSANEGGDLNPDFTSVYREFYGIVPDYGTQGVTLGLRDTTTVKAGLEYRPLRHLAVRAGYSRRPKSVAESGQTPVYPDLDRNIYSLGFGYEGPLFSVWGDGERVSDLSFDLFVRYAAAVPSTSSFPGYEMTYGSRRIVFGVGAGLAF